MFLLRLPIWMQDATRVNQLFNGFGTTTVSFEYINGITASVYLEGTPSSAPASKALSKGAIAGIVIGAVVGSVIILLALWAVIFLGWGRSRSRPGSRDNPLASAAGTDRPLRGHTWQYVNE